MLHDNMILFLDAICERRVTEQRKIGTWLVKMVKWCKEGG